MFLKPVAAVLNGKPCVGEKIEVYWSATACRVEQLRVCWALWLVDLKENDVHLPPPHPQPPPTTAQSDWLAWTKHKSVHLKICIHVDP